MLLSIIRTHRYPIRRQALLRAITLLTQGKSITIGGCQIINKASEWWIVREPAAIRSDIPVGKPGSYLWDGRFTIEISQNLPCRISALGKRGNSIT